MTEYFKVGKLVASHGLKGHLIMVHSLGKKPNLEGLEAIFLEEKKSSFIPYFVESASVKNDKEILVKLEGFDTKEAVKSVFPKEVWLTESDFKKYAASTSPIAMLGYLMIADNEPLGEIIEVIEQPHQVLCTVNYKGKEALIPVHDDSLVKVDTENKKVFVKLPDGLLEIYA